MKYLVSLALACCAVFSACGGEGSSSPSNSGISDGSNDAVGSSDCGKTGSVCDFKKADNVWSFSYSKWNYIEEYTWVDESTVEFKEYMNSYHMDEDDTTYVDVNRDEFFDSIMERCLDLNDLLDESSSSSVNEATEPAEGSSSDEVSEIAEGSSSSSNEADDGPGFTVTETCTEVGACDAMVKTDVSTWHFVRKDAFGDDAEYIYRAEGGDLIVTIKNVDGTTESKSYSMYNMETEVGVEMAFSAARSTCKDGGGNENVIKMCVVDSVYSSSSSVAMGFMTDERDGQIYKTVTIGNQIWMAENLNYAHTGIPYTYYRGDSDSSSWCYGNIAENCTKYGRLYTWATAMDSIAEFSDNGKGCGYYVECSPIYPVRGICPSGWHLPTQDEWDTLFTVVGGRSTAYEVLKSTSGWSKYGNGTDAFGFNVLPAGLRDLYGDFAFGGAEARFWSSSTAGYGLGAENVIFDFQAGVGGVNWNYGFSVRCVKD